MLTEWKKTVEDQWPSMREEWASERERLNSAREEWESKVQAVEGDLGVTAAKFDAWLCCSGGNVSLGLEVGAGVRVGRL
jgi:hypothetical protein